MLLSAFKRTRYVIAVAVLVVFAGCGTVESPKTAAPAGVHRVAGGFNSAPQEEFEFADGRIIGHQNLKNPQAIDVKYNDGGTEVIGTVPTVQDQVRRANYAALAPFCRTAPCLTVNYDDHFYAFSTLDGQALIDTELWVFVDLDAKQDALKFQGCEQGSIYSSSDLKSLMDVMGNPRQSETASSEKDVTRSLLVDDKLWRRFPVCDWRHRVGLDAAYPQPPDEGKVRIVPASHSHGEYVEVKADKGVFVDVYLDEDPHRLNKVVFKSPKASFSYRPVYNESDCPTLDRCEHAVTGPLKQPDRFDLHSLDDEPLAQSRIFEVDDTVGGIKSYDGCAGGRLYSGKNRDEVEREVKEALENPAPPPVKGAPVLGTPETSESGDTVIPDAFCDWTYRRKQAQALMNKSQGTR